MTTALAVDVHKGKSSGPNHENNGSFSQQVPQLQLGVDSTSLGAFKTCPRFYYYSIVQGWSPRAESVHLTFGLLLHQAREVYDQARASGEGHENALDATIDYALQATWVRELGRGWMSDHKEKNRLSLLRSIVWYLDQFADGDPLETVILGNGRPAVELSFRFDSGYRVSTTGEVFQFCGHLDRLANLNGDLYISDIKTTGRALDPRWFESFTPGNQFSMYTLASRVVFNTPVKGVILDGLQVGAGFTRFARTPVPRPEAVIDEWYYDTGAWLKQMEAAALHSHWQMNDRSCDMYGGCQFREVCSRPPSARENWLKLNYVRRRWDPLVARGEV